MKSTEIYNECDMYELSVFLRLYRLACIAFCYICFLQIAEPDRSGFDKACS